MLPLRPTLFAASLLALACTADTSAPAIETENAGSSTGTGGTSTTMTGGAASDPDDGSTSGVGSTGEQSTGAGTGEVGCPEGNVCLGAVPEGWSGPLGRRLEPRDTFLPCGGAYPDDAREFFGGLQASAQTCSCACEDPPLASTSCGPASLAYHATSSLCIASPTYWDVGSSCNTAVSGASQTYWRGNIEANVGGCNPTETFSFPEPTWESRLTLCAPASPPTPCEGDGVCTAAPAAPFSSRLCIVREDEHECPAAYPSQTIVHTGLDDERECSTCSCGPGTADCTGYGILLFSSGNCSGNPVGNIGTANACSQIANLAVSSARLSTGSVQNAACPPAGGEASGEVVAVGTHTVCCSDLL